jgi:hypothetical protein
MREIKLFSLNSTLPTQTEPRDFKNPLPGLLGWHRVAPVCDAHFNSRYLVIYLQRAFPKREADNSSIPTLSCDGADFKLTHLRL